ncbi:MAG: hypothetical protein KDC83_10215 [Flavobacteriales bacterium]|nr:hypothetical protein [Flavobacteriales bacterium]
MKIIAHRGASGHAPENTLGAFKKAISLGSDMIELDVRETLDHQVVVYHDSDLSRTTNYKGKIIEHDLQKLQTIKAGEWFGNVDYFNEKIPSLSETLEIIAGRCEVLVEIKSDGKRVSTPFFKNLFKTINKHAAKDWVILQSFDSYILTRIQQLDPSFRIQKLIVWKIPLLGIQLDQRVMLENVLKKEHYEAINVNHRFATPALIARIHRFNKKIFCWTVNEPKRMNKLIQLGVDGIITDYPDRLKTILNATSVKS